MKPVDGPVRRSVLITPGSDPRRLAAATRMTCDSVVMDLEDGVAPEARPGARAAIKEFLQTDAFTAKERAVRVNPPGSVDLERDLREFGDPWPDALWLPKVECAEDVRRLSDALPGALPLVLSIETPRGLLAAAAIAEAGAEVSPRSALFFGSGDYCMETGARPGEAGLQVPRTLVVASAAASDLQAIDAAYFLDPRDAEGTRRDARHARELGFDGKLVFHPAQIAPCNEVFAPDPEQVAQAARLVSLFEAARARGEGTVMAEGHFLAVDTVRPLRRILWLASSLGIDPGGG